MQVRPIGKINREIYKCIAADIGTDEAIITVSHTEHML